MALSGTTTKYYRLSPYNYDARPYTPSKIADATFSLTFNWNVTKQDVGYSKSTVAWTLTATALNFDALVGYNPSMDRDVNCDHIVFGTDDRRYAAGNKEEAGYLDDNGYTTWDDLSVWVDDVTLHKNKTLSKTLYKGEQNKLLDSGEFVLSHDSGGVFGSKGYGFELRIRNWYDEDGTNGWYINDDVDLGSESVINVQDTMSIDTIVRRAVIDKAPLNFTDEDSPAISYIIPEGMTGYIYLSMDGTGNEDTTLQAVTGTGTHNYVFSEADRKKIWAIQDQGLKKTRVKFFIKSTTLDNTTFRESSEWLNVEVINFNPEFDDPEVYDTNQDVITRLTGNKYKLVRYVSDAYFDTRAKGNKGATIESQSVKNGDVTLPGPTGTFEKVTSNEFNFTATDNYGRTVRETMQLTAFSGFVSYVKLTCNVQVTEMTAEGVATVRVYGKFFNGNFGIKQNRLRVNYDVYANGSDVFEHRDLGYADVENDGSSWSASGNDYEYTFEVKNLDYQSFYNIKVRVSDEIVVQGLNAETLMSATPIFDWGRRDFNFNVPVTIQGWEVDSVVEASDDEAGYYENAGGVPTSGGYTWSFRKWSSGLMECWCKKSVSVTFPNSWGTGLAVTGRIVQTNLIFPRTFKETPVVTATLSSGYAGGILMSTGSSSVPTSEYSTGTLEIARGGSTTTTTYNYTINYMVKGRWK